MKSTVYAGHLWWCQHTRAVQESEVRRGHGVVLSPTVQTTKALYKMEPITILTFQAGLKHCQLQHQVQFYFGILDIIVIYCVSAMWNQQLTSVTWHCQQQAPQHPCLTIPPPSGKILEALIFVCRNKRWHCLQSNVLDTRHSLTHANVSDCRSLAHPCCGEPNCYLILFAHIISLSFKVPKSTAVKQLQWAAFWATWNAWLYWIVLGCLTLTTPQAVLLDANLFAFPLEAQPRAPTLPQATRELKTWTEQTWHEYLEPT